MHPWSNSLLALLVETFCPVLPIPPFTVSRMFGVLFPFNKIHLFIICQTFILPHKGCSSQLDRGGSLSSVDGHRGACFLVRTAEDSLGLPAFLLGSPYATAGVIVQLCLLCAASWHFACLLRVCMTLDDTPLRSSVLIRAWRKSPGSLTRRQLLGFPACWD